MLSKQELKDMLEKNTNVILTRKNGNGDTVINSYADYKYHLGLRDLLVTMLRPKKREPKQEEPNEKLQKFGFENPIQREKKDGPNKK